MEFLLKRIIFLMMLLVFSTASCQSTYKTLENIRVRDPFIVANKDLNTYYLYAQTSNRLNENDTIRGVEVYTSKDLKKWKGPKTVFSAQENHWGKKMIWAPEVHKYKNKYYLLVTFTGEEMSQKQEGKPAQYRRGTQILVADTPEGPFKAFSNKSTTPVDWMSLDGTLWVEDNVPYMVFCHEWAQIYDGTMELVSLKDDLSAAVGEPETLFKATDAKWVKNLASTGFKYHGFVTDGCFVYKTKTGKLIMIWSSFGENGYALAQLISKTGSVKGPWKHIDQLIFDSNGGHGMIFETFDGKLMITLHQPNNGSMERAKNYELIDKGDYLILGRLMN